MTGSGKTGLCLSLIEEAAIDGVPVIAIDPKGDIVNLLLTFPGLAPADFRPWIDEDEARRAGDHARRVCRQRGQQVARRPRRVGRGRRADRDGCKAAADFTIYTPGSRAGVPVSILSSFAAPRGAARDDAEALAERAGTTATSVLSLAGIDAAPRSREHTLLSTLFAAAWRSGQRPRPRPR